MVTCSVRYVYQKLSSDFYMVSVQFLKIYNPKTSNFRHQKGHECILITVLEMHLGPQLFSFSSILCSFYFIFFTKKSTDIVHLFCFFLLFSLKNFCVFYGVIKPLLVSFCKQIQVKPFVVYIIQYSLLLRNLML